MATFYWVGGSTAENTGGETSSFMSGSGLGDSVQNYGWVRAFDYNNPWNWRVRQSDFPVRYITPVKCPSFGDSVRIATQEDTGTITGYMLPNAKAPLLWGGCTQSGMTVTWLGGGASGQSSTGTTLNSNIASFSIGDNFNKNAKYPFAFIGYGQGIVNAAIGGSEFSPLHNAFANGFTLAPWIEQSAEDLIAAITAESPATFARFNQLLLKTAGIDTGWNGENPGSVDPMKANLGSVEVTCIKNYASMTGGTNVVYNSADLRGSPSYRMSGYYSSISRSTYPTQKLPAQSFQTNDYAPRPTLLLVGATVGNLVQVDDLGSVLFNSTTNIGVAKFMPSSQFGWFAQFQNRWNMDAVIADLGNVGTGASSGIANLSFTSPTTTTTNFQGATGAFTGIVFGSQGITVSCNYAKIGTDGAQTGKPMDLQFAGNANFNRIDANYQIDVKAWKEGGIGSEGIVNIGELHLKGSSNLNLRHMPNFDGWRFGVQTGNIITGGIIFEDDTCNILGSQGVQMWNDQIVINGSNAQSSYRGGVKSGSPSVNLTQEG